jgi:hypothetical protein
MVVLFRTRTERRRCRPRLFAQAKACLECPEEIEILFEVAREEKFFARLKRKDVTADHADAADLGGTCFRTSSITIRLTTYFHSDAKTPRIWKRTAIAETFISAERGGAM